MILQIWCGELAGQVFHQTGYTFVLKTRQKSLQVPWRVAGYLKSLQDVDAPAADLLTVYFNNCYN